MKDDVRRKCYYCRETGHAKSQCRTRLKDLADGEGKPVTANFRPNSTAAVAPLTHDHVTTLLVTVPHVKRKSSCACAKVQTTKRSGAGNTCAGGGSCPRGSDQTAQKDTTVAAMQSVKAPDDPAHGNVVESHFDSGESHKFQVRYNEADVGFSISSAGKTSQGDWFGFDAIYQVMLSGPGGQTTRTCARDTRVVKLEENQRVYWLPGSATRRTDGAPLSAEWRGWSTRQRQTL